MPTLLVIDDDENVLEVFAQLFGSDGLTVLTAATGEDGIKMVADKRPDVVVLDVMLPDESGLELFGRIHRCDPRVPVLVISASGASDVAIEAMKLGAFDYLIKPLDFPEVRKLVDRALEIFRLSSVPVQFAEPRASGPDQTDLLVGRCAAMQEVYKSIGRVAAQNATVLIRGESGTGKELIARAIYQHSPRKEGKFLAVNCAAIPEALLESELFGHEKGAFTGAETRKIGKFEQCSGGTLFLDEIGDMTPLSQSKVLRVLQEQKFERVGGHDTISTDVRIIAATNRDLEKMVAEGEFRADLYYRLNTFTISLPPLRERGDDVLILVNHYLRQLSRELGKDVKGVSPEACEILQRFSWPGNVRQLQSVLKQSILHATGPVLAPDFLPAETREANSGPALHGGKPTEPQRADDGLTKFIEQGLQSGSNALHAETAMYVERILLTRVLRQTGGNQSHAAKILGITRGSLRNKIRLLHISIDPVVSVDGDAEFEEDGVGVSSS